MELKITINNQKLTARLPENKVIRQLQQYLPIEETFQRSGEHEYFCRLSRGLNVRDMAGTSDIHDRGIYYFDGWKALSFVYKDMNISPYKVVYLGDFTEDISAVFEGEKNKINVKLEVAG